MIFLYVFMAIFALFVAVVFVVGLIAFVQQRRQPLEKRIGQVHRDLLDKTSNTGVSTLRSGYYHGITDEMIRDIADTEDYYCTDHDYRTITFQKSLQQSGETSVSSTKSSGDQGVIQPSSGVGRQRESLAQTLAESERGVDVLKLRRDELGAVPKAEILRTAREHGWAFQEEEISGNEWSLLFRSRADQAAQGAVG